MATRSWDFLSVNLAISVPWSEASHGLSDEFIITQLDQNDFACGQSSSSLLPEHSVCRALDGGDPSEFKESLPALAGYVHYTDADVPDRPAVTSSIQSGIATIFMRSEVLLEGLGESLAIPWARTQASR